MFANIRSLRVILVALAALLFAGPALAGKVNKSFLGGVAIEGYDPVAYFTDGKPVEGSQEYTAEYDGATWRFASAEHRDMFEADPMKYAPQFGGYCAYGVAQGALADIDPDAWSIVDGKLYLNLNKDIQAEWQKDIPGYLVKAKENWPTLQ